MNVETDDLVVVSKSDDTIVYTVGDVIDRIAKLSYEQGYKMVSGGEMPVSCLMKPTRKQLDNSGLL